MDSTSSYLLLKLNKSICCLKQASREWNGKLSSALTNKGFIWSKNDHYLLTKKVRYSIIILTVYADDVLVTWDNSKVMHSLKQIVNDKFKIKDFGAINIFLGLEFIHVKDGIIIH